MHPIVDQVQPSAEQVLAVEERGRDTVVTAGAGTGKTRTLVARYLALLAGGMPLRSILAITFTRKAAREMRNRVREEMRRYLERPALEEAERGRWQVMYNQLDAARISTIHSFCTELLRSHPAEAGVDPRFNVLEEGPGAILRGQAVEEALAWAADDPEAVHLFALLGERTLGDTVDALLARRLDVREALTRTIATKRETGSGRLDGGPRDDGAALLERWAGVLRRRQAACLARLTSRQEWQGAAAVLTASAANDPQDPLEVQRSQVAAALAALAAAEPGDPAWADALSCAAGIRLGGGSARAWPGGGRQRDEVKGALRAVRDLCKGQSALLGLALNRLDEALAAAMPAVRALFGQAIAAYTRLKEERQALDYDDLEQRSLELLQADPGARRRWQSEIGAILVDEFQDTNARQRELVALLNDGGKLTIVGDAKQSIYRFRGADVVVFRQERERIESQGGLHCELATSYRAHRALVQALNDLLRPILGEEVDPERPWAAPFAPLRHEREEPGLGFASPYVELHLALGTKSQGALERAASALAGRILELVEGGTGTGYQADPGMREKGGAQPLGFGDFAILCRASRSFTAYEDALEQAGIPYLTVAGGGFYERAEVRDLLNALRALADPTDDLALAGLLRSPGLGLPDSALLRLVQGMAGKRVGQPTDGPASLWEAVRQGWHILAGEEARRAEWAARIVEELHGLVGRLPVADVLKRFLDATGYRAALIAAGQGRGARNVGKLLADAHASGIVGVGEFLEYVDGLRTTGAREGEARATAEGAVQIMSVHQAKGLEFPVAIVGDATHVARGQSALLLDPELGVVLRLKEKDGQKPAVWHLAEALAQDQEQAESDRLLYVACTRAREMLILSGCASLDRAGALKSGAGWLARLAGDDVLGLEGRQFEYDAAGSQAIRLDLRVGASPAACTLYEPEHRGPDRAVEEAVIPEVGTLPPPLLEAVTGAPGTSDGRAAQQEAPQRVWRVVPEARRPRAPSWLVGVLLHEALKAWRFPGDGPPAAFDSWVRARARGRGLIDARQLADCVREAGKLLRRFRAHPLHDEMAGAEVRWHEVPFSAGEDSGIIDALYRREGRWTLVEFKTDEVRDPAALPQVLESRDYRTQVERYATAAERLLGERPRCALCWLDVAGRVCVAEIDPSRRGTAEGRG